MVLPVETHASEGLLQELFDGVRLVGGDDVVAGLVLLQHHPHRLNVIPGEAPVTSGREVTEEQPGLQADADPANGAGDLAGHEVLAAARALVVEEDPVAGEQTVSLTVVDSVPVSGALGGGVRGPGVEWGCFRLGRRCGAEHLRRSGLIVADAAGLRGGRRADGIEEAESAGGDDVGGVIRDLEGDSDMGLSGEIVDLVRKEGIDPAAERGGVGEVGIVETHPGLVGVVGIDVEVIEAGGVEVGGAANEAMDLVALVEEELGEV